MNTVQIILFSVSMGMGHAAVADCAAQAKDAKAQNSHHLIITMEGLMGGVKGRAYTLAKNSNEQLGTGATIKAYSHVAGPSLARKCIAAWKAVHGSQLRLTLVGHSFGGNAVMRLAENLKADNTTVDDMLLIDGRNGAESFGCRSRGLSYQKPTNVQRATAVFQNGCLAGRSLASGPGVSNINESAGAFAHVNLPSSAGAVQTMTSILSRGHKPTGVEARRSDTADSAGNAESLEPVAVTFPAKTHKCELQSAPGVYQECSRQEAYGGSD